MIFFSHKVLQWAVVLLCFFSLIFGSASINNTLKNRTMPTKKKSVIALLFTTNASFFDPDLGVGKNMCRWLKGLKQQRKQCQHKKGLAELLQKTRQLTLDSCQLHFQYEHWNCSAKYMKKIFKKMYRETAFMYSLATSAFMHVVAQACVDGKLANCKCASHPRSNKPKEEEWAGCSVNTRYASMFVEKYLELKHNGDNPSNVMMYNSQVGLRVARRSTEIKCTCHGVSGSCNLKTCTKKLVPFDKVAHDLKQLYHNAIQVEPDNSIRDMPKHWKKKKQLLFLDPTPNYCDYHHKSWFLPTMGRRCRDVDTCATLCCSNEYETSLDFRTVQCNCSWRDESKYLIQCGNCKEEVVTYYCK